MATPVPTAIPVTTIAVGSAFILAGLFRPSFLWELGKVRAGREWVGDGGVAAFFVVLGVVLIGIGVVLVLRR